MGSGVGIHKLPRHFVAVAEAGHRVVGVKGYVQRFTHQIVLLVVAGIANK